jgi:hypothetical protein
MTRADRIAQARTLVRAASTMDLPKWLADQLEAASRESRRLMESAAPVLQLIDPGRGWQTGTPSPDRETVAAVALTAVAGSTPCAHLRRAGPQPAFARLPLRRIDCRRCAAAWITAPAADGDRCDWCGTRGVTRFTPIWLTMGPLTVMGDACDGCAGMVVGGPR